MDASLYIEILEATLLPFLEPIYPDGHCFMAENDPKHTSTAAKDFVISRRIKWWRTPAESPNCNPVENL